MLSGKASHLIPQDATSPSEQRSFSTPPHKELFGFAETAVQRLCQMCAGAIGNFLVRVDIMKMSSGKWVVNEFESFEAVYVSSSPSTCATVQKYLDDFWKNVLLECAEKVLIDNT